MIFFHNENALCYKINPILLGKGMEFIRPNSHVSKIQIVSVIGVNRTTVIALEQKQEKGFQRLNIFIDFQKNLIAQLFV